ncbi:MAG TPA: DNA adenine methylase [Acidobacteriaceae bacterium]
MLKTADQNGELLAPPAVRLRSASSIRNSGNGWLPGLEPSEEAVRPFLRWAGGKTRLMQVLLPHFPSQFASYHEPFLGGGSVFFAVRNRAQKRIFLSDLNTELINAWQVVRDFPEEFLSSLEPYSFKTGEKGYYFVRDEEAPTHSIERAARFFYLNQTSWNSLWRVNRWGVFNVPWGARGFRGISASELQTVSAALQPVCIEELDFREALERPNKGDFVYLDPPYLPVSDTSKFAGYTEKRFRIACLSELATCCERLSARGVSWVLSNRDTRSVRELFSFAKFFALTTRRSVAAQNRRDVEPSASPEIIVIGKGKS